MNTRGLNTALLIGRVTNGPQIRITKAGSPQASFDLETTEIWNDKQTGERREKTITHRVVAYGGLVKTIGKFLQRGARVFVQGMIETRRWSHKEGGSTENWTCEVIIQGFGSQLVVLDLEDGRPTPQVEVSDDVDDASAEDSETSGLSRFLNMPDDNDRARRRSEADQDRKRS